MEAPLPLRPSTWDIKCSAPRCQRVIPVHFELFCYMPSHKLSRFSAWCVFLVHQVLIAIYYSTSIFNPAHSGTANEWAIQISSGNFIGKLPLVPIGETGSIFHASPVAHGMAACFECCHSHRRPRLVTTVVCQHMDNVLDIY